MAAAAICAEADALQDLGRADEARALYLRAGGAPRALFGLARMALEAGDWDEAAQGLSALTNGAAGPELHWLAGRIALGRGEADAARQAFEAMLGHAGLSPAQRAEGLLLLAEALDGLGEPAAAFAAATEGKQIQRRLFAGVAAGREPIAARLRRLKAWFDRADPDAWARAPAGSAGPATGHVFLVGFPRSGTTLLEQALAGSPAVCALEEAPTLAAAHDEFLASDDGLARLARLSAAEAETWRARYWAEVAAHGAQAAGRVFLDKAPAATEDLPLVARLFPEAKVLFALRDPRDVVLSCLRQNFRMNAMTYAFTDLAAAAECYDANMALAETYRRVLPLDFMEVRHEALVGDFEGELCAVCGFIGVEFDAAMLDVAATARRRAVRTPSAAQVRNGLNARGLGRWRAYAEEIAPVLPRLAPWVARFGYPPA